MKIATNLNYTKILYKLNKILIVNINLSHMGKYS